MIYDPSLFCHDLPTRPSPGAGRILVTGAGGYIGGRLVPELIARGYCVRVMVRGEPQEASARWPEAEVVVADALNPASLERACEGVGVVYYLIHSMLLGRDEFARADARAAANLREAAERAGVRRIIYLGGLGDLRSKLSQHLHSRIEVALELYRGDIPVTILRAAVIIGSGSASYEIIKNLVQKLPAIPTPRWARSLCQPISVRDVIKYLVGVLETPEAAGGTYDIGGEDVLTYRRMMEECASVLQLRRLFFPFPIGHIGLFSYLASLLTPVPDRITRALMEGLRNDVVCLENSIRTLVPFKPLGYREAVVRALTREEQDRVHTRWSDAYPPAHELALKLHEMRGRPEYSSSFSLETEKEPPALFASICRIGGREGWFSGNWMWRLRGMIDRLMLGVGSTRGRRRYDDLAVNDVVDFWRVEEIVRDRRLLLRAEMKLPGEAWLEFDIEPAEWGNRLTVAAHYFTRSFRGKLYWYSLVPFHLFIFKNLIIQIERRS